MLLSCGEGAARGLNSGCLDMVLLLQGEGSFTLQGAISRWEWRWSDTEGAGLHRTPGAAPHLSKPFLCLYAPSAEGHLLLDVLSAMGHPL